MTGRDTARIILQDAILTCRMAGMDEDEVREEVEAAIDHDPRYDDWLHAQGEGNDRSDPE